MLVHIKDWPLPPTWPQLTWHWLYDTGNVLGTRNTHRIQRHRQSVSLFLLFVTIKRFPLAGLCDKLISERTDAAWVRVGHRATAENDKQRFCKTRGNGGFMWLGQVATDKDHCWTEQWWQPYGTADAAVGVSGQQKGSQVKKKPFQLQLLVLCWKTHIYTHTHTPKNTHTYTPTRQESKNQFEKVGKTRERWHRWSVGWKEKILASSLHPVSMLGWVLYNTTFTYSQLWRPAWSSSNVQDIM